jgi:hypothetical protein
MVNVWHSPPVGQAVMEAGFPAQHWVLQLVSDYSMLQSSIEMAVEQKLSHSAPAMAKVISKKFLRRLTDDDRWSLVKALASDCGYTGDLGSASNIFWKAKRVRDLFAHRSDMLLVREPSSAEYFYLLFDAPDGIPKPLTPAVLRQLSADCRWLRALVDHLSSLAGTKFASFMVREREDGFKYLPSIEILSPPPLPVPPDWEPVGLARETGESDIPVQQSNLGASVE